MQIYFNDEKCYETKYSGYFVTTSGKVITIKKKGGQGSMDPQHPREYCYKVDKDGYLECCLSIQGVHKYIRAHRLVYETLCGSIDDNLTIDHIDQNKQNNSINNLRLLPRGKNAALAHQNWKNPNRFFYKVDNEVLDRQQIERKYKLSKGFWYQEKNKINEKDYKINDLIIYRV